jgi:hypothetical protein
MALYIIYNYILNIIYMCTLYWFKKIIITLLLLIFINLLAYIALYIYIAVIAKRDYYSDIYAEEQRQLAEIKIIDDSYQFPPWDEMMATLQYDNS